jgi:hypothetical protein
MFYGFTGTREGTSDDQRYALRLWFDRNRPKQLHHGACVGADADMVTIAAGLCLIVAHPPEEEAYLSAYAAGLSDRRMLPLPYLVRNRAIVDACQLLIACPKGEEEQRSGTWSTVRYAREKGKPVVIIWPTGIVEGEVR